MNSPIWIQRIREVVGTLDPVLPQLSSSDAETLIAVLEPTLERLHAIRSGSHPSPLNSTQSPGISINQAPHPNGDLPGPASVGKNGGEELLPERQLKLGMLDTVLEVDPGAMAVLVGAELKVAYSNPAFHMILAHRGVDPIGQPYAALWPPEQAHLDVKNIQLVLQTGVPYQKTGYTFTFPEGQKRTFTYQARRFAWDHQFAVLLVLWDTTELDAMHSHLAHQGEEFRSVIESMGDPMLVLDLQGKVCRTNPAASLLFGKDPVVLNREELIDILRLRNLDGQPVQVDELPCTLALAGEQIRRRTFRFTTSAGEESQLLITADPLINGNGHIFGAVTVWQDLTEHERLHQENRRLGKLLVAQAKVDPSGQAFIAGPDLVFKNLNPAYRTMTPHPHLDPLGQTYDHVWPPEEGFTQKAIIARVLETGEEVHLSRQERRYPDGTTRYFTWHLLRLDWDGEPAAYSVLWDITELVQAEEALRQNEQKYRTLFTSVQEGYTLNQAIYDGEGRLLDLRVLDANPAAEKANHLRREDFVGKTWRELWPEAEPYWWEICNQVLRTGKEVVYENYAAVYNRWFEIHNLLTGEGLLGGLFIDTTRRKQAEQAEKLIQEQFNQAFEASPNAQVISRREDGFILTVNASFERLFEYSREEVIGKSSLELDMFVHPADRQAAVWRLRAEGSVRDFEVAVHTKTGQVRQVLLSAEEIAVQGERHLLTILHDITERKQAESQLRLQSDLLENVHDAIIATDLDLTTIAWNKAAERLYGWTAEEAIGKSSKELLRSEMPDVKRQEIFRQLEQTGYYEGESVHYTKDGRRLVLENHTVFHRDLNGQPDGYIASNRDITERKKYEAALHLSQKETDAERQRWQGIVDGIADEVWVCDLDGKISLINLETVTEMGLGEFKNRTVYEVLEVVDILTLDGQMRPAEMAPLLRSLKGEVVRGEEIMRHRQTGRTRYRQFSSSPTRDAEGAITGAVAIIRDITEQKKSQEAAHNQAIQIELQRRLLEQREQERLEIARDLHDGPVQELTRAVFDLEIMLIDEDPQRSIPKIKSLQTTLQSQINELRNYASELRPPTLSKFGLGIAIRSHLEAFKDKHPELRVHFEEAQVGDLIPEAMRLALYRIYQEAITNLTKHSQAQEILIRLSKDQNSLILDIQDNGIGFEVPSDWLELARAGHLGLVGMRERTEAIGGRLTIRSSPGSGTHLQVAVPINDPGGGGQQVESLIR